MNATAFGAQNGLNLSGGWLIGYVNRQADLVKVGVDLTGGYAFGFVGSQPEIDNKAWHGFLADLEAELRQDLLIDASHQRLVAIRCMLTGAKILHSLTVMKRMGLCSYLIENREASHAAVLPARGWETRISRP